MHEGRQLMNLIKKHFGSLFILGGFIVVLTLVRAQETPMPEQTIQSLTDLEVMLQALESTTPVPPESLPRSGTFWSAQFAPGSHHAWPPLPGNILGLPVWPLGDGSYLLDDRNVDWPFAPARPRQQSRWNRVTSIKCKAAM